MIDDIMTAMCARLAASFPDFTADPWPDKNSATELVKKREGFFVNFDASNFSDPTSFAPMSVDHEIRFVITIRVLSQRGPKGITNVIPQLVKALLGWTPTKTVDGAELELGTSKFVPVDCGFVDETSGVWRWAMTWKCTIPAVENLAPPTGPLLKQTTFKAA